MYYTIQQILKNPYNPTFEVFKADF